MAKIFHLPTEVAAAELAANRGDLHFDGASAQMCRLVAEIGACFGRYAVSSETRRKVSLLAFSFDANPNGTRPAHLHEESGGGRVRLTIPHS